MVQITVEVSDEAYKAAKLAAQECGMFFRRWVDLALLEKAGKVPGREPAHEMGSPRKPLPSEDLQP